MRPDYLRRLLKWANLNCQCGNIFYVSHWSDNGIIAKTRLTANDKFREFLSIAALY